MRPNRIVLPAPLLDENLGLLERIEDLPIHELVLQLAVEALIVPILPRAARFDEQGPDAYSLQGVRSQRGVVGNTAITRKAGRQDRDWTSNACGALQSSSRQTKDSSCWSAVNA